MDLEAGRPIPVSGLLRAARAVADLSQRALADRSGVSKTVISRMETDEWGDQTSLRAFVHALNACGFTITIHSEGRQLVPDADPERDRGKRRFPPHLEPHVLENVTSWWGHTRYYWNTSQRMELPTRVYHVNPRYRDEWRAQQEHPWSARFWADTEHLAPPFRVHPLIEARRRSRAAQEARDRHWAEMYRDRPPKPTASEERPENGSAAGD